MTNSWATRQSSAVPARVALAGAGMISWHHLTAWKKLQDSARIVAICDPDEGRARDRAAEFDIPAIYQSADALFAEEILDAIDIATPRETHAAWVRAAVSRNVAVLCQKPLAPTFAEAEALVREVYGTVPFMVHENWRFNPIYRELKKWIAEGRLGEIQMVRCAYLSCAFLPDETGQAPAFVRQPFMKNEPRLLIAEAFIHHIDVARFLCGPLRVVAARAARTLDGIPGETLASILMETDSGAPVDMTANMAAPGYPARGMDEFDIIGSRASARVRGAILDISGAFEWHRSYDSAENYQSCFDDAIRHFVDGLGNGLSFETDPLDNLETLRLVEHTYQAAGMHTIVPMTQNAGLAGKLMLQ